METKGNNILWNTKTKWISMVRPIKHVLSEYCTFLMKTIMDAPTIALVQFNLCLLTDVKRLLGLNAIMPLLEAIHFLIELV